jgi:quinol-cytochrome oxidoreductase complex cytochrome b subunit
MSEPEKQPRPNFFHHLHPPSIPAAQAGWGYTLGAGGIAVFLTLVVLLTGALEMFFYVPTPQQAGESVQMITFLVPFGGLVRGLHYWSAQALMLFSLVHLARVVLTGAFTPPRRFNYLLGLGLLVLLLFLNFTGYVLRWDEGIRWALVVGTNLLKTIPGAGQALYGFVVGGAEPGAATLLRFYAWHVFGLMLAAVFTLGWHLFRVRRDGGIAAPAPQLRPERERISRFELTRREVFAMLAASAALLILTLLVSPPLEAPIAPGSFSPPGAEVRAPWFFLWVQQLLRYGDAFWMGIVLPVTFLGLVAALPYLFPYLPEEQKGRWLPPAGRAAQWIFLSLALVWLVLTLLELR